MTKLILLCLVVSFNSYAQNMDELTLESKTAPTVVEDESELSLLDDEEAAPKDAPDSPDVTENVNPEKSIPAQLPDTTPMELTNKSAGDTPVTETPEVAPPEEKTEVSEAIPDEAPTPNPIAEDNRPNEEPKELPKSVVDQTPPPAISTPVITTEAPKDSRYIDHRKSHWLTTFGFEGLKYDLPFDFDGQKKNFGNRKQELWGARVGIGGQLYLGWGFWTASKVEAFYNGTLFTKIQNAGPDDVDEEVAQLKRTGGVYGAEVSQQLGFLFEFRTKNPFMDEWSYLTLEPFVEAGVGAMRGYNSVTYHYTTNLVNEQYRRRISDKGTSAKVGGGFNMTSRTGYFLYVKATAHTFDIDERIIRTHRNGTSEPDMNEKDKIITTVYALGGGYKF